MNAAKDLWDLFSSPHRQRMLEQANEGVPPFEPDSDWDRWADCREGEKGMVLPTADFATIAHEIARLERPSWKGRPHE